MLKESEHKICIVCSDIEKDTVFIPCGHLCCCNKCATPLKKCPICRVDIQQKVKTFT